MATSTRRLVLGAVLVGLAAAGVTATAFADETDNSVRFASSITLPNVDPYFNSTAFGNIVADAVWDTLIFRNPRTGDYQGLLATSWRWVDDTTLELELRRGVRFHNGAAFDADDVVYTLNFVTQPENRAVMQEYLGWIDHAEKVEQYRVRIVAKRPFPAAIAYLALPSFVIHDSEYYAQVGPKGMNERPVGSGPFRVVEHALGKTIRLERNPDYFTDSPKQQPSVDSVEMRFIPDAQTRVAETLAGGLDLIMFVARDQAEQLRSEPGVRVVRGGSRTYLFLRMNVLPTTPAPQLRDVRVRQAIMHAIDRETVARFVIGSDLPILHTECHPSAFGCTDEGVPRYAYDPERSRQLLAEAGFPSGFDIDLFAFRDRNETEALIGYLAAVGIRARMRFLQAPALTAARRAGRAALVNGANATPVDDVAAAVSRSYNFSADDTVRDAEVRDLIAAADSAAAPDERKALYASAFRLIAERAYALPLYVAPMYYVANAALEFTPFEDGMPRLWEMRY
jgi:peptide/nickel transport system substrate-binding protein